jgi:hypothetical protein
VKEFCRRYSSAHCRVLRYIDDSRVPLLLIRYEDLTKHPHDEFRRICSFLGETFEADALVEKSPDLKRWKPDPHVFGEIVSQTKKWQEYISLQEAKQIEQALETIMKKLGYSHYC